MTIEEYFREHSLKEETAKQFGWTWNDNVITIPICDPDGNLLYNRYRHLNYQEEKAKGNPRASKFSTDPGSHPALYAVHLVKEKDTVVLCEGEPDCVRLWQEGIPSVCGTSGVRTVDKKFTLPLRGKKVLIVLDTDEDGLESIEKYYNILVEIGAEPYIKEIPPEYKDVSEYFTNSHTGEDFLNLTELDLDDWHIKHEPEEFKWESAADIRQKELPKEKWLVNKAIPIEGFTFFIGPEASSKSYQSLSIAKCVVTGEPWLPQKQDENGQPLFRVLKRTRVLIMDKESTKRRIQDRLRGYDINTKDIEFLAYPQKFEIAEVNNTREATESGYTKFFENLAIKVKKNGVGLIILDSFTDFFIGEENDRGHVQKFFDSFRQMFPGIAILCLHHSSKMQPGQRKPTSQLGRGSTNIMAQAYTAFHFEPIRKSKTEFTVEQTKAGDSLKLNKFKIESQIINDPLNKGETLVTSFVYLCEVDDKTEITSEAFDKAKEILEAEGKMFRKEFESEMKAEGYSPKTVTNILKRLKDDGLIKTDRSKVEGRTKEIEITWQYEGEVVTDDLGL
jgi:RecA-family ATPase